MAYLSKDIQNEILGLKATHIFFAGDIFKYSTIYFFSLMADETTDAANKEQLVIVYRWIDDEFGVHEDFVGLRELGKTHSQSILHELTKSMNDLHLDVHRMHGRG